MDGEYISQEGYARLCAELQTLQSIDRPAVVDEVSAAAAQGDRSENAEYIYGKKRLREIDRRMGWLQRRLKALVVVDAAHAHADGRCFFGAWVTLEDDQGHVQKVRILGADEVDLERGVISYRSPFGRAVLGRMEGDTVVVRSPAGDREWTVTNVQYGASTA